MKHPDILKQLTLEQKAALLSGKDVWSTYAFPQAGVPSMVMSDGPHGRRRQLGRGDHLGQLPSQPATCFPTAACLAGSWDPALLEEVGRALGTEAAAQGVHMLLGPGMNLKRSPLGGRNFEYFSEDPYLSGKLAAALVRGRDYVNPEDVELVFPDVVPHRLLLSPRAEGDKSFDPAAELLARVSAPRIG